VITILKLMQSKLDHIVKTTLARPSLKEVGREELLMLTQEFPYTPVLQFLYTKRLQQSQDPRFGDSVTRTALFFNNPHWLNQQLRETTAVERVREQEDESIAVHEVRQAFAAPAPDTIEHEGNPDHILSASEQALIDSITEAPDESLLQDESETLALETRENESVTEHAGDWETETAEPEDSDPTDAIQSITDITTESVESTAPDFDGSLGDEVQTEDEMITVEDQASTEHTETSEAAIPETEILEPVDVAQIMPQYAESPEETGTDEGSTEQQASDLVTVESEELPEDESPEHKGTDEGSTEQQASDLVTVESEEVPEKSRLEDVSSDPVETIFSPDHESTEAAAYVDIDQPDANKLEPEPIIVTQGVTAPTVPSPLITVIASIDAADIHPIHTIRLTNESDKDVDSADPVKQPAVEVLPATPEVTAEAEVQSIEPSMVIAADMESDNDDDASIIVDQPEEVLQSASPEQASYAEPQATEPPLDMAADMESDNDDDASEGLIDQDPFHMPEIPEEATDEVNEEEFQPSGLEHLGFQPEELLEASDAADDGPEDEGSAVLSTVEAEEGWETSVSGPEYNAEDDDHPDATDPGDMPDEDTHSPVINPGDLIRMAGLDMHTETELSFEPLHLTDYFASVGVSLPQDEQPDVFSRQSRSFTGWIRSMKRIHPEKIAVPFTQTESEQIRNVAEQSNEQEEVLTETMAGIYAMQGLTHKAIDIYEKLSLLNPEKSAIFAAKLSELKGKLP
jgi:hypothetical protein